ncbi:MAG: hypothetical protein Kow00121_60210 [Elainellaceae cyanobacterium]
MAKYISKLSAFLLSCSLVFNSHLAYAQSVDQLFEQGSAAQRARDYAEAESIWQRIIQLEPRNAIAYNNLGLALYEQGNLEKAIEAYQKAIELDGQFALAYRNLGIALYEQNKFDEAIDAFQQSIIYDQDDAIAYNNLALVLYEQGEFDQAIDMLQQVIRLRPDDATAYNNLGLALYEQGEFDQAVDAFQQVTRLRPDDPAGWSNLREAERLQFQQDNRSSIDDKDFLPSRKDEPLVSVLRSTARIVSRLTESNVISSIGAGFVIKREGETAWILTNRHVVSDSSTNQASNRIEVEFFSELDDSRRPRYPATIEQLSPANDLDLAVLRVTGIPEDIEPLQLRSGQIRRNTSVRIIGHPYTVEQPWSSLSGEVINYSPNNAVFSISSAGFSTGIYSAAGNSGGPVIDEQQRVIGIMVSTRNGRIAATPNTPTPSLENIPPASQGIGLAYRIDVVLEQLQQWRILD